MDHAIELNALTRCFGPRTAVDHLDLKVASGELFALLGQNGAGKTTTLRMLAGLLPPTSGDALLCGHSITGDTQAAKQLLNVSPQENAVAGNLTVRENLEFIARVYGADKASARDRASEMMRAFSLEDRARDRAKALSGGLQRRLSLAMALISEPRIVLLDEPTLGLDVRARRDLWKTLLSLKGKVTIVLTTHYMEEAEALADRIAILHGGHLRALGTAAELKALAQAESFEDAYLRLTDEEVEA